MPKQKSTPPLLDNAAFRRFEAVGQDRRTSRKFVLSPANRERLTLAVRQYPTWKAFINSYSSQSVRDLRKFVAVGGQFAHALTSLQSSPTNLAMLLYKDEGTAMAVACHVFAIETGDPEGDRLFANAKHFLIDTDLWIAKARRRLKAIGVAKRKGMHNWLLCWEVADVFEASGGRATIGTRGDDPFARFVEELYAYLPEGIRPRTSGGLVEQCRLALKDRRKRRARRNAPARRADDQALDVAIRTALVRVQRRMRGKGRARSSRNTCP
jgi:hypothetical protein